MDDEGAMDDGKVHPMRCGTILIMLVLILMGSRGDGAICPVACRCQNEILRATCVAGSLEIVPIQLNPELHDLDISCNKIVYIHFSLPFYEKLLNLNLSHNRLRTLGNANFHAQKNLTLLDLNSNRVRNLTKDSLKGLKALKYLDLSNNSLEEMNSAAFRELHSLMILKLCANRLVHLEEGIFRSCKNLRELYLNDNQFLDFPTIALTGAMLLRHLTLSRNLILTIENGDIPNLPALQTLLLDNNLISDIHPDGLSTLLGLTHLDLSDNNITAIPTAPLAKLSTLTILGLGGNFISRIPPVAFRSLFHLRVLNIDRLETLRVIDARAFVDNINLQKIYMDYNIGIEQLPSRLFHGNSKIKLISVTYNSIQTFEAINFPLDQLRELRVGGNPLNCNCSLGWLWQLIKEYEAKSLRINETDSDNEKNEVATFDLILDDKEITCAGPEKLNGELLAATTRSQMDCSVSWMAVISVTVTVTFILLVIGGVVYWAPKRKSRKSNAKEIIEIDDTIRRNIPLPTPPRKNEPYDATQMEKYIISPPMMIQNDYRSLPPWDPYGATTVNIYEQLNEHRGRPHIVYV